MSQEEMTDKKVQGKEHLDFITAIILIVVCIAAIVTSYGYYKSSGNIFYESPGFMPTVIATAIILCSMFMLSGSLKGSSVSERISQLVASFGTALKSNRLWNSVVALLIFGIYIIFLLKIFPFWLASIFMLCFTFFYTNATSAIKILLTSVLCVAGIVLLFQVAFNVPLP